MIHINCIIKLRQLKENCTQKDTILYIFLHYAYDIIEMVIKMGFFDDLKKAFGLNKSNLNNAFDNKPIIINNNVDTEENTSKYVVSSVDELKKMQDEVKKEKKDDIESYLSDDTKSSSTPSIPKEPKKKYVLPTINILDKPNIRENNPEEINKKKEILFLIL